MAIDELVRRELAAMAEQVRPAADPLARLAARRRRGMRTRIGVSAFVAITAASAAMLVSLVSGGDGTDKVAQLTPEQSYQGWIYRLVGSSVRGAVAATDLSLVTELSGRLSATYREGLPGLPAGVEAAAATATAKVLFVDDVGPVRVAFAVFVPAPSDHWIDMPTTWLVAPRGATAKTLASTMRGVGTGSPSPFETTVLPVDPQSGAGGEVAIGLAPDGCEISTAELPAVTGWRPEPTGSYVARAPGEHRSEWWRVTCAGVVRAEEPARGPIPYQISAAEVDPYIVDARGTVDRGLAQGAVNGLAAHWTNQMTGKPTVIWGGRISAPEHFAGRATAVAVPLVGGGWMGELEVRYDKERPDQTLGTGASFYSESDPSDPSSIVLIPLGTEFAEGVLVIAPEEAVSVRAVRNGQPLVVEQVQDSAAVLDVPTERDMIVEAVFASGNVVGTAVTEKRNHRQMVFNW
jgi:hypothetical protein